MAHELHDFLSRDHERLDALLERALNGDLESYRAFRSGLVWHIGVEEKILFPLVRAARGDSELLRQLHRDHAALGALLMPPPNGKDIEQIRAILRTHNPLEENAGGFYDIVEATADVMDRVRAFPPVPVAPHRDSDVTRWSIEELLRSRTLHEVDVDEQSEVKKKTE
jgi:hypothetical protein